MADLLIRADRIITPAGERSGIVEIRDGVIAAISEISDLDGRAVQVELAPDEVLLPGLVDSHVHVNEPGRTEWEGFATATAAAAAGGVTTIADMPLNSIPATVDLAALETKRASTAGKLAVDVAFWGGAVPGNVAELYPLWQSGVVGFKCFLLPSGVDEFPPLDRAGLLLAMRSIAEFGGLLIAHAEDQAVIDRAPAAAGRRYQQFLSSRPADAEVSAIGMLIDAVRETGCRTHIVHLSAASALPVVAAAKAEGLPLTVETCPHYLALTADTIADGATQFKCCPPIRESGNREQLWEAIGAGVIDSVVSDHSPATRELKRLDSGDFGEAWGGIASLQLGLPVIWTEASRRGFALTDVLRWMSAAPARLIGLDTGPRAKGAIAAGYSADLVVFAPEESFVVDPARLEHRNPISPYATDTLDGVVRQTWLRGQLIRDAQAVPDGPRLRQGRMLTRPSS
jgi:allantoinase